MPAMEVEGNFDGGGVKEVGMAAEDIVFGSPVTKLKKNCN